MLEVLKAAWASIWATVSEWATELGEAVTDGFIEDLPGFTDPGLAGLGPFLSLFNQYVPLDLFITLFVSYWTWVVVVVVVRWILKFVPLIG